MDAHDVVRLVRANLHEFRSGFDEWIVENAELYLRFEEEAERMRCVFKRRTYSAATIIEYLRHWSAINDKTDAEFKINDKWTRSLARLYALRNPSNSEFFAFREKRCA